MYNFFKPKSFFTKFFIFVMLCGIVSSFNPQHAGAQVQTTSKEQLQLQIQQLLSLIVQLKGRLATQQVGNSYAISATGQQTIMPGLETAVARVFFTLQEKQSLRQMKISLLNVDGVEKPWEIFERIRVYDSGNKTHDQYVASERYWTVEKSANKTYYNLTLPEENISLKTGSTHQRTIAFVAGTNIESSEWNLSVPSSGVMLTDLSAKTRYLGGTDTGVSFFVEKGSLSDALSCQIAATQESYAFGEDVKLEWSSNAVSARFVDDMSGKGQLPSMPKNLPATGSTLITAYAIGNPYVTMEVTGSDGSTARCKAVFRVLSKDKLSNGIVSNMQPAYGSYSIDDAVPVSWSMSGVSDATAEACVSFYRRPIIGRNIGYGSKCYPAKNGIMTHTWYPTNDITTSMTGNYIVSVIIYTGDKANINQRKQSVFESKSTFTITPD